MTFCMTVLVVLLSAVYIATLNGAEGKPPKPDNKKDQPDGPKSPKPDDKKDQPDGPKPPKPDDKKDPPAEGYLEHGTGYYCKGNYLLNENIDFQGCVNKCSRRPKCVGFIHSHPAPQGLTRCMLKQGALCGPDSPEAIKHSSSVLYLRGPGIAPGPFVKTTNAPPTETLADVLVAPDGFKLHSAHMDCDPRHDNLRAEILDLPTCGRKCVNDHKCVGFVFYINGARKVSCIHKLNNVCRSPFPNRDAFVYKKNPTKKDGPQPQ